MGSIPNGWGDKSSAQGKCLSKVACKESDWQIHATNGVYIGGGAFQGVADAGELLVPVHHRWHLDLWAANAQALREAGLAAAQIEIGGLCTACRRDEFFSHRAEGGKTGRFGALIGLQAGDGQN